MTHLVEEGADAIASGDHGTFRNFQVNLLVDHSATHGAPIVFEDNPTYTALLGRIEYQAQYGALVTDFNLIRSGALYRANGGYLVIDARKLLTQPFAWESLKRALRTRELRIESLGQAYSLISTVSLEPEPLALDVKIILEGDRTLYYLLQSFDPEFAELFKVAADFDEVIERSDGSITRYVQLISTLVRRENLRTFNRTAVAAIIDYSARLAEDTQKLSTRMRDILPFSHAVSALLFDLISKLYERQLDHYDQPELLRMGQRIRRSQDDRGAARPSDPSLPYHPDWQQEAITSRTAPMRCARDAFKSMSWPMSMWQWRY